MNTLKKLFILLTLIVIISACQPMKVLPQAATAVSSTQTSPAAQSTPTIEETEPTSAPAASAYQGFVLFNVDDGVFQMYGADGTKTNEFPAQGIRYAYKQNTEIVKDAVYYTADGAEKKLMRVDANGPAAIALESKYLSDFAISPDEARIAWSNFVGDVNPPYSEIWVAKLDSSHAVQAPVKIATYSYSNGEAFNLIPFEWSDDGKLLFERQVSGIGGYILFGGHNSMYTYDPANGQIATIIPAEENHLFCVDGYFPELDRVVFNCLKEGPGIRIRNLIDSSEQSVPVLEEQGAAGSARFSPSGQWLAYAIAKNDYENERGQVIVVPGDLSAAPQVIAKVENVSYPVVHGWLDENTIFFSNQGEPQNIVLSKINRDGSGQAEIAKGIFIGWIR